MAEEEGGGGESVSVREHLDISIVMLILIAFFVLAFAATLRYTGNHFGWPGLTAFAGG